MTINAMENSRAILPAQAYTSAAPHAERPEPAASTETGAVSVNVSEAGQRTSRMLSDWPPLTLDPKVHMQNAQDRLKVVMQDMGIPPDTKMDISVRSDGHISVTGDHEKLAELEKSLNNGDESDLRNSLIGVHSGLLIQRVAGLVSKAGQAADQTPLKMDALFEWARGEANKTKSMRVDFSYENGTLSAALRKADGTAPIPVDKLTLPA